MGEIRFVGTGEKPGYPYLVCKKIWSLRSLLLVFIRQASLVMLKVIFRKDSPSHTSDYK